MLYSTRDAYIGRALQHYGEYSEDDIRLFDRIVKPGHTILDVGANIGAHTVYFAATVGAAGKVYAFEPLAGNFQLLSANLALNRLENCSTRQVAVGSTETMVEVPRASVVAEGNQGGFSFLDPQYQDCALEPITQITIDALELSECHLIKADVEGMEAEVVIGASDTLKRCRPMLYLENNREDLSPTLIDALLTRDYKCFWHLTKYFNPENFFGEEENIFPTMFEQNILAVPNMVAGLIEGLEPVISPDDRPLSRSSNSSER
ncbi:MAG TPA: FkbM family methyltransferase [Rhodospirillaceae bacterium]|nr:FkbM family methyltransferase [Rhodospirillaceae bacterium]